jgi:peroxin-7
MPQREVARLLGHTYAVRRLAFSPHAPSLLATCAYDMTVRAPAPPRPCAVWDCVDRAAAAPARQLSPLFPARLLLPLLTPLRPPRPPPPTRSAQVRLWDYAAPEDALLRVWDHHTEFAVGLDWSTLAEGMLASCGWDGVTYAWHTSGDPRAG